MKSGGTAVAVLAVALAAAGCGKKDEAPRESPTAGSGQTAGSGAAGAAGPSDYGAAAGPVHTAAGGEVSSAPTVTECPRSLAGPESVNRVITRDCGVVVVTASYQLNNGTLTLERGSTLAFKDGAAMEIGYNDTAKLIVKGTADAPVTFTAAGDKVPGVWKGVWLYDHADRSSIDHLIIEYAGEEERQAIKIEAQDVAITSSTIRASKGDGVALGTHGTFVQFSGNAFDQIARSALSLGPVAAGGLGTGNKFPDGALIAIYGGTISRNVKWTPAGAPFWITENVNVEGSNMRATLEIGAGTQLRFAPDAHIYVGYSAAGGLKVTGTQSAPVVFGTVGDKKPGSWQDVRIYANGEADFEGAVFEYGGGEDEGALRVEGAASIKASTFRGNTYGVDLAHGAKVRGFERNSFLGNRKGAALASAEVLGSLGEGNAYDPGTRIAVDGGKVEESVIWRAQAVPLEIDNNISIDGRTTLTVEAGTLLVMKDGTEIEVGSADNSSLRLLGTPDKPIKIVGLRDEPGSWRRIVLHGNSRDSVIQNVVLRNAKVGLQVDDGASVKIEGLTCAKCAESGVSWGCTAKVTTASVIKAEDGTPKAEDHPDCH
jgi:hypothetical protein